MNALLIRRLAGLLPTLVATSALIFAILSLGPSPLALMQEFGNMSAEDLAAIAKRYGWDQPLWKQYLHWLGGFLTGDLGMSVRTLSSASDLILPRLPLTLTVAACAMMLSIAIGVPVGAWVAVRRYSGVDYFATLVSLVMMASPAFFLALVLQIGAVWLRDTTGGVVVYASGVPEDGGTLLEWIQRLTLPILTLSLTHIAMWVRYQRSELIQVLSGEYIKCARAKGLPGRTILMRHAMRNAVLPLITLAAIDLGKLVAGAVIVESVFGLPGIGTLLLDSVNGHDTVVVLDILMMVAIAMVLSNTLADLLYGTLDPRVREA